MGCVYRIVNRTNGLSYVGQVTKLGKTAEDRFREHVKDARCGVRHELASAIRASGFDAFSCVVLAESTDDAEIDVLERYYIAYFNTNVTQGGRGYNMTSGGQGTSGFKWSEASRDKKRRQCPVTRDELKADIDALPWLDVANKHSVSALALCRWVREFDLVKRRVQLQVNNQNKGAWSVDDEDRLIELYVTGSSNDEIAHVLCRTMTSVVVKLARLKRKRGLRHRRFRNQHQPVGIFKVKV